LNFIETPPRSSKLPAWLNNNDEIDRENTQKEKVLRKLGAIVSRKSVSDLVVKLALTFKSGSEQRSMSVLR
jgi:hypothetical protein